MTIGRRMTATATVPLRKVREATVDALETLEQHAEVINGQGAKLKGLGERVADVLVRQAEQDVALRAQLAVIVELAERVKALETRDRG